MEERERELRIARELARSFPDRVPPNGAEPIGHRYSNGMTFYYYKDKDGNYYYESDRGYRIKEEMYYLQKRKRKLKQKKRST